MKELGFLCVPIKFLEEYGDKTSSTEETTYL